MAPKRSSGKRPGDERAYRSGGGGQGRGGAADGADRGSRGGGPDRPGEPRRGRGRAGGGEDRGRPSPPPLVYGRNPVRELLRAGRRRALEVQATAAVAREGWLRDSGAPVVVKDASALEALAGTADHQGVVCRTEPYPYADASALLHRADGAPPPLVVCLDEVTDPQNLGAIARTAECAGATGLVLPDRRSAQVTPAAAKASAGAVEHLQVAQVRNLADYLAEAKRAGLWAFGAAGDAEDAVDSRSVDWTEGVVLVLGAEGKGLRPRVREGCDALVALPLLGQVDSLNVSAAAAVLLYGIVHARLQTTPGG